MSELLCPFKPFSLPLARLLYVFFSNIEMQNKAKQRKQKPSFFFYFKKLLCHAHKIVNYYLKLAFHTKILKTSNPPKNKLNKNDFAMLLRNSYL
jgi:hypothetical protein